VYCTARINANANRSGAADQDIYLRTLRSTAGDQELARSTGHLLVDVLDRTVDAAIVISNDSDCGIRCRKRAGGCRSGR